MRLRPAIVNLRVLQNASFLTASMWRIYYLLQDALRSVEGDGDKAISASNASLLSRPSPSSRFLWQLTASSVCSVYAVQLPSSQTIEAMAVIDDMQLVAMKPKKLEIVMTMLPRNLAIQ